MAAPVIKQDAAMVCIRRGCEVIYSGTPDCPECGFIGVRYRSIEMLALESTPSSFMHDQPVKTRMIQ
ncbi:MAG TPA: hypothetical protein VGU67_02805 [Edaphobacter sp.]|nr:hypothetical protein [Edaphobacter sp.]